MTIAPWLRPLDTEGIIRSAASVALQQLQQQTTSKNAADQLKFGYDQLASRERESAGQLGLGYAGLNQRAAGQQLASQDRNRSNDRIGNTAAGNLGLGYEKLAASRATAEKKAEAASAALKAIISDRLAKNRIAVQRMEDSKAFQDARVAALSAKQTEDQARRAGVEAYREAMRKLQEDKFEWDKTKTNDPNTQRQLDILKMQWKAKQAQLTDPEALLSPREKLNLDREVNALLEEMNRLTQKTPMPNAGSALQETGIPFAVNPDDRPTTENTEGFELDNVWDRLDAPNNAAQDLSQPFEGEFWEQGDVWNQTPSAGATLTPPPADFGLPQPPMAQNLLPWVPRENRVEGELYDTNQGQLVWDGEQWVK